MGTNLRKHRRRAVAVEFHILDADDEQSGEIVFDSVDLSPGGAFLRSDLLLRRGELLEVTFRLPGFDVPIKSKAKVVWATARDEQKGEPGIAIEFVELDHQAQIAIAAFLQTLPIDK